MKSLLLFLMRALARLAASEAGELLSVRRKSHLLQAAMYTRLADDADQQGQKAAPPLRSTPRRSSRARCMPTTPARLVR